MKFAMAATASSPAVQMVTAVILAVIIYVGIQLATLGNLTVGNFVSFFAAIAMLLGPLKRLAAINEHIQKGLAACESVFSLLDMKIESQNGNKELFDNELLNLDLERIKKIIFFNDNILFQSEKIK